MTYRRYVQQLYETLGKRKRMDNNIEHLGNEIRKRETLGFSLLEIIKTREINYKYQKKNLVDLVILRTLSNVLERNPTNQYRGFHVFP